MNNMEPKIVRIEDIIEKVEQYDPGADFEIIKKAYVFSAIAHKGQLRKSGEPYLQHPLAVAYILAEMHMDEKSIVAGLLHDVVEDTMISLDEVSELFDKEVVELISAVTKISEKSFKSKEEQQADYFRRMILGISGNIKVIMVKLADRLHNMRTLSFLSREKAIEKARETLDIFAPLAYRLGMFNLKSELQDLSLRHIDPENYNILAQKIQEKEKQIQPILDEIRNQILEKMAENAIAGEVQGRIKRIFSIYDKMKRQSIPFERVYDFIAFRIIVETIQDCYGLLGLIHNLWTPVPGRIKDYIATPKPNFYQSLHTSVMTEAGFAFEVQIRTKDMNEIAENGIAAHWLYKEGKVKIDPDKSKQFLKQLYDWQTEAKDPHEFMKSLKSSLYPDEVYVLTPKGDVRAFPPGATPVDFAYSIHSQVGTQCIGAKVNGKIVPLNYKLQNGDVIDIITQSSRHPSPDWLSFVVTSRAKNKIKIWLNTEERSRAIEQGKKMLEQNFRKKKLNINKYLKDEILSKFYAELGYNQLDDFFAAIGYSKVNVKKVVDNIILTLNPESSEAEKVKESLKEESVDAERTITSPIKVSQIDGLLITMGKCCSPIKGEEIVGFVTKGRGISIHSYRCPNREKLLYNPDKLVQVEWDNTDHALQTTHLLISTEDLVGVLAEITDRIAQHNVNIKSFKGESTDDKISLMKLTIEVQDIKQLEKIVSAIKAVKGVISIKRAFK